MRLCCSRNSETIQFGTLAPIRHIALVHCLLKAIDPVPVAQTVSKRKTQPAKPLKKSATSTKVAPVRASSPPIALNSALLESVVKGGVSKTKRSASKGRISEPVEAETEDYEEEEPLMNDVDVEEMLLADNKISDGEPVIEDKPTRLVKSITSQCYMKGGYLVTEEIVTVNESKLEPKNLVESIIPVAKRKAAVPVQAEKKKLKTQGSLLSFFAKIPPKVNGKDQ